MVRLPKRNRKDILAISYTTEEITTMGKLAKELAITSVPNPQNPIKRVYYATKRTLMRMLPETYHHRRRERGIDSCLEYI